MEFNDLLRLMSDKKASDLFITVGRPPSMKVDGRIRPVAKTVLTAEQTRDLAYTLMSPEQREEFRHTKECNFGISAEGIGRFRVSAYVQRDAVAMVLRRIETRIPDFEDLKLPPVLKDLAMIKRGLIIFVGATGTGKSTSLAAMLGYRNRHGDGHIITIEDPIEYLHHHQGCIVSQREVGIDTESYEVALKNTLRQAPDVILIGEIRTREVMEHALTFAETGHLVLSTLHANNANQALERILHFFPEERLTQVLMDLSLNLKAILAQQLVPRADGNGRRAAVEVLLNTPLASDLILKGEIHELKDLMKRSREHGMITFDQALYELYLEGEITEEDALKHADSANEVRLMIKLGDNTPGTRARDMDAAMLIDDY
ncbi:MAG TPA: PilT/PilU family type 4a pilus ATPase [Thiolapillus brandeum]|uniref:PilT/PilU family type 4a pilus ATPase n=1 Tax=Thiolapillus brandeum TaxID=1076588 RepID=A0A7C5MXX3_9GAMM|nr:PilT/PilU family type 4a pilus ATPase [Thiolapillus brandeum]